MEKEAKETRKRIQITQKICDDVKLLLDKGLTQEQTGKIIGIDPSRVSRIKTAGFDLEKYKEEKKKQKKPAEEPKEEKEEELPGQIRMELTTEKPEMNDQTKMMRFLASQFEKVLKKLDSIEGRIWTSGGGQC